MSPPRDADSESMPSRVGIDLIAVESVDEAVREHDRRYLERIYTPQELSDCRTDDGVDTERLAARFAAKEATMKVLRQGDEAIPWSSIGVHRHPAGSVQIELSGRAAALAADTGVGDLAVSLTHDGGFAAAVVIADSKERKLV
jgi:holo-[acyl-carrier protein] synthase